MLEEIENDYKNATEFDDSIGVDAEYGQEYLGNWYSEDGYINFIVDSLFTPAGNCPYIPGEYAVNNNIYDVTVNICPYHTSKYDGAIIIYIPIPVDEITEDAEPVISGEYQLSSDADTLTVIVREPDIDGLPPTYEDTKSIYNVGDEVVFKKQQIE